MVETEGERAVQRAGARGQGSRRRTGSVSSEKRRHDGGACDGVLALCLGSCAAPPPLVPRVRLAAGDDAIGRRNPGPVGKYESCIRRAYGARVCPACVHLASGLGTVLSLARGAGKRPAKTVECIPIRPSAIVCSVPVS